jgi:hypothetical protein
MTNKSPSFYGWIYLILIPIFAFLYLLLSPTNFSGDHSGSMDSFLTCLYYSTVTITTLGYGDISAKTEIAQLFVILETILGVITIGLFLNSISIKKSIELSQAQKEKDEKEKFQLECEKILRHNKIIEQNMQFYLSYANYVAVSRNDRDSDKLLSKSFTLNDMKDMFRPTYRMTDNFQEPAIKYYYKHQAALEESIKNLVLDINFSYWKDLEQHCIEFLSNCKTYNFSESLLAILNYSIGEEKATIFHSKLLERYDGDYQFKDSNACNQFLALHKLIKLNIDFIEIYTIKINEIKNNCE